MRLPLLKILWGTFALPAMFRGAFFKSVNMPLLGIIGSTLLWTAGGYSGREFLRGISFASCGLMFSWLAIRCHRLVLLGSDEPSPPGYVRSVKSITIFLVSLVGVWIVHTLLTLLLTAIVVAVSFSRYVPAGSTPMAPPVVDPDVQRMVDWIAVAASVPGMYLAARLSPLFPAIALEHKWDLRAAWQLSRGNGWRLMVVVVLLPALFNFLVGALYRADASAIEIALLIVIAAVLTTLEVIALSLSYRELTASLASPPAPPPTHPPA
jgi:hypothetical protein